MKGRTGDMSRSQAAKYATFLKSKGYTDVTVKSTNHRMGLGTSRKTYAVHYNSPDR